jgi:3-deoxy-D-manno-octulosonic-acid transferase
MYLLYSALLAIGLLLALPYWLWEMLRHGKYRTGFGERMGKVPIRLNDETGRTSIWIHAVSVGEVLAVSGLVRELLREFPQFRVIVSTTTDAGQELARTRFGEQNVFYFPLDFSFAIRSYLRALQPRLVILAETEFWPNFLRLSRQSGSPVAVVNARISDRSLPGYRRFRFLLSGVLQHVDLFLAQTSEDAGRLREIGAQPDRVRISGNLKFDVPVPPAPPIVSGLRDAFGRDGAGPIVVCGSTVEGEESLLIEAFENVLAVYPKAVMILAPRHPQRFEEVSQLLEQLKIRFRRRSAWNGDAVNGEVLLVDTIGELAALYVLADIAFVGGSLVPRGGHNIIEPAQHGVAVVVGSHMENFRDILELFQSNNAVRVVQATELASVWMELLSNEEERRSLGRRAAETLMTQTGATTKTLNALRPFLNPVNEITSSVPTDRI